MITTGTIEWTDMREGIGGTITIGETGGMTTMTEGGDEIINAIFLKSVTIID